VGVFGGPQRCADRLLGSFRYRDTGDLAQIQQRQVVLANLLYGNVSRGRRDADNLGVVTGEQIYQRHRVVDARIDVHEHG
jgi:hypothetical protein